MGTLRRHVLRMLFIGLLPVGGIVACTPGPAPETSAPAPVAARPVVKKIKVLRRSEMTPVDKQVKDWAIELKKSHEIFREVWAHVWEDRVQNPMSVFFEVERLLHSHKNPTDGHFVARRTECPNQASEVLLEKSPAGEIQGAVFYRLICRGTELLQGKTEIARVRKEGRREVWTYWNETMPRAAGQSMAFLREKTECVAGLNERARLVELECRNLGQNRNSELHLNFSRFRYDKNSPTLVEVEGKKFKLLTTPVCDSPKFCTRLRVPVAGSIEIFEDTVSELAREERRQAMIKKEREEEAQAALERHKKNIAEMQKAQQPAVGGATGVGPQAFGAAPVIPGQTMDPAALGPTSEPQFGDPVAPAQAGVPSNQVAPPVVPVGPDGIATGPVMEFDHGGGEPVQTLTEEEYNARLGQPAPVEAEIPISREAQAPIER